MTIICFKPVPRVEARQFRRRLIVREAAELLWVLLASSALGFGVILLATAAGVLTVRDSAF